MNAIPHHVQTFGASETSETEDPRNGLLDAFEQFVEALKRNDMGLQARLRFEKHFPPPLVAPPASRSASRPEGAEGAQKRGDAQSPAGELGLTALLGELKRVERLKMSALAHQAVAAIKAKAEADLAAVKAARAPAEEV